MIKIWKIIAIFLLAGLAGVYAAQSLPQVVSALAAVMRYEEARRANDFETAAAMSVGPMLESLGAARDLAMTASQAEVRRVSVSQQLQVLTLRALVLDGFLKKEIAVKASARELMVAIPKSRPPATQRASAAFTPLAGFPVGSGRVRVWLGPEGFSPLLSLPIALFNSLYVDVLRDGQSSSIDPAVLFDVSAKESVRIFSRPNNQIDEVIIKSLVGYSGAPADLWRPLNDSAR